MQPLRVTFVAGVTPDKWARTWRERLPDVPLELLPTEEPDQLDAVRSGAAEMAFVRLPVDRTGLHVIPLYEEVPVAVLPKEHLYAGLDEVVEADLADEHRPDLSTMTVRQAVEVVASGTGVVVLPMSVARLHHRKDVVAVPVADLSSTTVALAWPVAAEDPRLDEFVGVVRGRTRNSSRGGGVPSPPRDKGVTSRRATGAPRGSRPRTGTRRGHGRRTR
ncbi:MAG TPA: LysR substrate-binding domain-containing protein [Marmoricola sp.]|nr:LysR substrate-binding domain-containing protein [Marmoricola sp.]